MKNIILGVYYTDQIDVQRKSFTKSNDYEYIKPWYESIHNLNLKGILFHDKSCDVNFIDKYQSENVKFYENKNEELKNISFYLHRFLTFKYFLSNNIFDNVFMTDVSDVTFKKNPFDLIEKNKIIIGCEQYKNGNKIITKDLNWAKKMFPKLYESYPYWDGVFLNCGIVGGTYSVVFEFLEIYERECFSLLKNKKQTMSKFNHDMTVCNMLVHKYFSDRYVTGMPIHTIFKKYDIENDVAFIVHK